ncbi:uncharacterized protein LOC133716808 [Rosa rugosa]|uniref:uncharacterized protein LOC133716808 n=1 Tax=Rosa rugosa TaxID=74645 RepID=UPI002B405B92|nr:uncharacterized protein LOC133716808 [Rosa rugosa]
MVCLKKAKIGLIEPIVLIKGCRELKVLDVRDSVGFTEGDMEVVELGSHIGVYDGRFDGGGEKKGIDGIVIGMLGSEGIVVGKVGNVVAGSGGRVNLGAVGRFGNVGLGRDGIWVLGRGGICVVGFGSGGNGGRGVGIGSGGTAPLGTGINGTDVCNRCLAPKLMSMLDKHNAATMIDNREQCLRPAILVEK